MIVNTGDRPVQIGSHLHLPDANAALEFDRAAAHGFRLDIPSGTSRRFEPGASREVADRGPARAPRGARASRCGGARWLSSPGASTPRSTARPSATRCASATPTCGSRSSRTSPSAARRPSSAAASRSASRWRRARDPGRGRAGHRHHQRDRARPLGHRAGRRRHPRRPDRRARPGRQPRHRRRRAPGPASSARRTDVISGEGRILTAGAIDIHVHFLSTLADASRRWRPASPPSAAAAPDRRRARRPPPSPRAPGTCGPSTAPSTTSRSTSC